MEKVRPASAISRQTPGAGAPYALSAAPHDAPSSLPKRGEELSRRVTAYNIATFEKRTKELPPDACLEKAPRAIFYQFPDRVTFYCSKCRKDGISSDSLAFDAAHGIFMCTRCFERVVRPRKYRPSRVVPFPSLLSWLNYKPATVMTSVSEDILARPAEAAAPSGARAATEMLGGARQTDIRALPATPSSITVLGGGSASSELALAEREDITTHPCVRVWGRCAHGETCFFKNAPRDLCIAFLMGLCPGSVAVSEEPDTAGADPSAAPHPSCSLHHQRIEGLPAGDVVPRPRMAGDLENTESELSRWVSKKRNSANRVEWQLFHNGPLLELLNVFVPEVAVPPAATKEVEETPVAMTLNKSDIASALAFLKKK